MKRKIIVLPQRQALEYLSRPENTPEKVCLIAVCNPGAFPRALKDKARFYAFLEFDDVPDEKTAHTFGLTIFDDVQALWAGETLIKALKEGCLEFVFSCEGGRSRSAGLAAAFAKFLEEKGISFQLIHTKPLAPNPWVREKLYQALKGLTK